MYCGQSTEYKLKWNPKKSIIHIRSETENRDALISWVNHIDIWLFTRSSLNSWLDSSHCLSHSSVQLSFVGLSHCHSFSPSLSAALVVSIIHHLHSLAIYTSFYSRSCLSALLTASVYTNTHIWTCICSLGLPMSSWPETASLQIPKHSGGGENTDFHAKRLIHPTT